MATGSSLTRSNGVRRTGGRNKFQLESLSPDSDINFSTKKGINQGESDSDFTVFTSSTHASTSSATSSIDRYNSGMEGRTQQRKKTLDKSNSKKRWSFRLSKKNPQAPLTSSPDDDLLPTRHPSPVEISDESPVRKPVLKITRSGSLRSLKIVRNKSRSSKGPTADDLHSKKATFSSILKDSKFPEPVKPQESEEIIPVAKLCPYQHCSLHGDHHHHHEPPVKRFSFLKRRSSKDQKGLNPKTPATINTPPSKKTDVKGSKSKKQEKAIKKDADFSIEFYAKTRTEHVHESSSRLDDADLADIMFGVNGSNQKEVKNLPIDDNGGAKKPDSINGNRLSMWRLLQQHMVSDDLVTESGCELDQEAKQEKQSFSCTVDDAVNQENENRKMFVIKIVREAIQKVLPEVPDHQSVTSEAKTEQDHQKEPMGKPDGWSHTKKVVLLRKFITELEKVKHFNPKSEAETESLRPQTIGEKKSSDDHWMLDYALQQVVRELSPNQKRKVAFLVKAFESVAPKLNDSEESSFTDHEHDEKGVESFDQKTEKEKYMKMWHMVYQHVVADITSKVGPELLHDNDDDKQEVDDMMLIRQSVNEILLPEGFQEDELKDRKEDVDGSEESEMIPPRNWNKLRKLRRSIKELESSRKGKPERQVVDLRRQKSREKTKAEQWMIDYAVQHIVTKLTPARKKRVSMLVEAFESVIPLPDT